MTLRFAAAVLFVLLGFAGLLYATQIQRDLDRAVTSRLDPLPLPQHHGSPFKLRG